MIKVRRSYICNSMFIIKKVICHDMCSRNSLNLFQQQFWYLPSTFWTRTCCICLFLDYFQLIKKKLKIKKKIFFLIILLIFSFLSASHHTSHFLILPIFTSQFSLINSHITWALAALPASWRDIQSGVLPINEL